MVLGAILRPAIFKLGKYVYQGLRQQERIIDYTYRKTGLYNRGIVRGIKHGLAGGQIIGGGLSLGLNASDSPGNDGTVFQPRNGNQTRKSYQTRSRFPIRYRSKRYKSCKTYRNERRPRNRRF